MDDYLWLPVSSEDAVNRFKVLAREELGLELDDHTARDEATAVLHVYFLKEHVLPALKREADGDGPPGIVSRPRPKVGRPRKQAVPAPDVAVADGGPAVFDASVLEVGESVTLYPDPAE